MAGSAAGDHAAQSTSSRPCKTRFGPIPSEEGEVNGQALQVFARLYWVTGDARYLIAAERIARAYLELALPDTGWIPTRTWDFERERVEHVGGPAPRSRQ